MKSFYKIKFKYPKQPRKYKDMFNGLTQNELVQIYQKNNNRNIWMELIERNHGFFFTFIRKYPDSQQQDLYQQFTMIVKKKMDEFDFNKGVKFQTHLIYGLMGENSKFPRENCLIKFGHKDKIISSNINIYKGDSCNTEYIEVLEPVKEKSYSGFMVKVYSKLNEKERIVIKHKFEHEYQGAILGLSREGGRKIKRQAFEKIKNLLENKTIQIP